MTWSLSKLGTYERCAAKFKYKYIERLPEKQGEAASRGSMLHAAIEKYLLSELDALPEELDFYTEFLRGLRGLGTPEASIHLDREWKPVESRKSAWYTGIQDLLIPKVPTIVVYDWKTGREYPEHYQQKEIYAIAALAAYPEAFEARMIHVYVDSKRMTDRTYHRDQAISLRTRWEERVERMDKDEEHIPNPSYLCRYCSFSRVNGGPCRF